MGKKEYFNVMERYFVCGYKRSKRFINEKGIINLDRSRGIRSICKVSKKETFLSAK